MKTPISLLIGALLVACSGMLAPAAFAAKHAYRTHGECNGLPRLDLTTPSGFCVALIADDFRFPRGLAVLPNGNLVVADMGGWDENKGSLWLLRKKGHIYEKKLLLRKLDRPNGIVLGPDGKLYVGVVGRIFRFSLKDPTRNIEDVIGGNSKIARLPGTGRHPLTQMAFDAQGNLFVNVGSSTDNCEKADDTAPDRDKPCPETEGPEPRGAIRKYVLRWPEGKVVSWETYARGLRNSMALAVHPKTDVLWQAENSRDAISRADPSLADEDLPHDELNRIEHGGNYGWPYCYDANRSSPEYAGWDCRNYAPPAVLLPAHAAPLGMSFYTGQRWPAQYHGALLIAYHGYRQTGHRLVAYPFRAQSLPAGKPLELIGGWGPSKTAPMGAPVDVRIGTDESVYMTEDRNGTIIKLVYTGPAVP